MIKPESAKALRFVITEPSNIVDLHKKHLGIEIIPKPITAPYNAWNRLMFMAFHRDIASVAQDRLINWTDTGGFYMPDYNVVIHRIKRNDPLKSVSLLHEYFHPFVDSNSPDIANLKTNSRNILSMLLLAGEDVDPKALEEHLVLDTVAEGLCDWASIEVYLKEQDPKGSFYFQHKLVALETPETLSDESFRIITSAVDPEIIKANNQKLRRREMDFSQVQAESVRVQKLKYRIGHNFVNDVINSVSTYARLCREVILPPREIILAILQKPPRTIQQLREPGEYIASLLPGLTLDS